MLSTVLKVAQQLTDRGLSARVLSMHTLRPIDAEALRIAARETRAIVTVEEHSEVGGLSSAVAEVLCQTRLPAPVTMKRVALPPAFSSISGSQGYLRAVHGLSVDGILHALEPVVKCVRKVEGSQRA